MKKHFLTSILTFVAASCFAIDAPAIASMPGLNDTKLPFVENSSANKGLIYVRMNVVDAQADQVPELKRQFFMPGLGIGYRKGGADAIDISVNFNTINTEIDDAEVGKVAKEILYWSAPKVSYLRYFSPKKSSSFYYGLGLGCGGVTVKEQVEETTFFGMIPSALIGFETNRKDAAWRSFMQLEVSQPALAVKTKGDFPGPIAEISVGFGY